MPLTVCIKKKKKKKTCGKFIKRCEYQTTLRPHEKPVCGSRSKLEPLDWFKISKGVCQGSTLSPYLFNLSSSEMPGWVNLKLESRLLGEILTTSDMQMTPL